MENFEERLASFVAGCEKITNDYVGDKFPRTFSLERGSKYIRVVADNGAQRGVHCFIDTRNGDVLKAAGWKAPAKHARGNIFDENNGLGSMQWTGPAYLR